MKCTKSVFTNDWVGCVGQSNSEQFQFVVFGKGQMSIFSRTAKNFSGKNGLPPVFSLTYLLIRLLAC